MSDEKATVVAFADVVEQHIGANVKVWKMKDEVRTRKHKRKLVRTPYFGNQMATALKGVGFGVK